MFRFKAMFRTFCRKGGFDKITLKHRAYHSWQLVFRNPVDFT